MQLYSISDGHNSWNDKTQLKVNAFMMDKTKAAVLAEATDEAKGIAQGHVGENKCDSRIYGASANSAHIFSVR